METRGTRRTTLPPWAWLFIAVVLGLAWGPARAQVAVLVHGYLGDRESWAEADIDDALVEAGWVNGGHVVATPRGARIQPFTRSPQPSSFFAVELPSEAPLAVQAKGLAAAMAALRRHFSGERFILVGHSAGGLAARLYAVTHPDAPLAGLVTIASPHLGTDKAGIGLMAGQSPLGMMAPFMGLDSLNRSQGLFADLLPARPGSPLHWLNNQDHPAMAYVSVVRREGGWSDGDLVVPPASQRLENVPALAGRARSVETGGGHLLRPADGPLLARILGRIAAGAGPDGPSP